MRIQTTMYTANADRLHGQRCCPPCVEPCVPTVPAGPPDPTGERLADALGVVDPNLALWSSVANDLPVLEIRTSAHMRDVAHACGIQGNVIVRLGPDEHWVPGAFSCLVKVSGYLAIAGCNSLSDLGASFSRLRVSGGLYIDNNAALSGFGTAFSRLTENGGNLYIYGNLALSTLGTAFTSGEGLAVGGIIILAFNGLPVPTGSPVEARFDPRRVCQGQGLPGGGWALVADPTAPPAEQYDYGERPRSCDPP